MVRSIISGMAKATTIKTWRAQYLDADNSVSATKKNNKNCGGRVEPDFPVDGHIMWKHQYFSYRAVGSKI